jgi:hypothetical protein
MVPTASTSPAVALVMLPSLTVKVSFASASESCTVEMLTVVVVAPAGIVPLPGPPA